MPENPLEQAHFDHVDDTGDLVFAVGNLRFSVAVDDTLERAILEAKQIRSESQPVQPQATATLPISQIQSLIRAGADPQKVAERYGLSEALVRRFSAAVETEKQYAIDQFLAVPAPKNSRMRTMSELIEHTLATARIGMETLSWQATRRGLEPWRIVATFSVSGRAMRAEWTWNMHGNTVVCVNTTAKQLLGERADTGGVPYAVEAIGRDDLTDWTANGDLPGDSLRSARIERAVSQWNGDGHPQDATPRAPLWDPPHWDPADDGGHRLISDATPAPSYSAVADAPASGSAGGLAQPASEGAVEADHSVPAASPVSTPMPEQADASSQQTALADHPATPVNESQQPAAKPEKRKSGRSPMPSWDEILFGE